MPLLKLLITGKRYFTGDFISQVKVKVTLFCYCHAGAKGEREVSVTPQPRFTPGNGPLVPTG
jgi:hypothetical protein